MSGLDDKLASALCYLLGIVTGVLFLVIPPYNQNPRVKFHAFQSIFFSVAYIVLAIGLGMVTVMMPDMLSAVMLPFYYILRLGGLAIWLYLMWQAYQGQRVVLPVIGPLAAKQSGTSE